MRKKFVLTSIFSLTCIFFSIYSTPVAAKSGSTFSDDIENLFWLGVLLSLIIVIIVFSLLGYMLFKFRESKDTERRKIKNPLRVEIAVILFAFTFIAIAFLVSLPIVLNINTIPEGDHEVITVYGQQFNFIFERENGTRTIDELVINQDQIYIFNLTSLDVIHSFYVPDLSIKVDMVPGRYNEIWLEVEEPGEYMVHCAEYCGFDHYDMHAKIIVV
ncbi:MAG: cytochrome c oxidase subunit II [Promethearchaeota archaeon]